MGLKSQLNSSYIFEFVRYLRKVKHYSHAMIEGQADVFEI